MTKAIEKVTLHFFEDIRVTCLQASITFRPGVYYTWAETAYTNMQQQFHYIPVHQQQQQQQPKYARSAVSLCCILESKFARNV